MISKWLKQQERRGRKKLLKRSRNNQRQGRIRTCPKIVSVIVALVLLLALLLEQSSDVKLFEVSTSFSSSSLLGFSPSTAAEVSDANKLTHSDSNNPNTLPESSASFKLSTPTPKPPMKPKYSMNEYPKELHYIPSDRLQPKDYFSGSFFVSRDTFMRQLKPRHFVKLESASLETSANVKTAKMMVDWTCLAVEHFSHWWKTLYRIQEHIEKMDNGGMNKTRSEDTIDEKEEQQQRRMLTERIAQIFQEYIQVTAPQQLQWNLEYHEHRMSGFGNLTTSADREEQQQHPMQRTIAAIAFQPYRLPKDNANLKSSSSSTTPTPSPQQLQQQEELEELLTVHSLAATIASLVAAGFGRVLVVGYNGQQDQHPIAAVPSCVEKAFRLVQTAFRHPTITLDLDSEENTKNDDEESSPPHTKNEKNPPPISSSTVTTTAVTTVTTSTSLGYAAISDDTWVRNYRRKKLVNLQMGVVTGLQTALKGYMQNNVTREQEWLGHNHGSGDIHEYWKYVFLTEPDLLLHTKPWALSLMAKGMDEKGLSYFPHRLQPLPHQADFAILKKRDEAAQHNGDSENDSDSENDGAAKGETTHPSLYSYLLPNNIPSFSNITKLEYLQDDYSCCCCDELTNEYPGRSKEFGWRQHQFPCEDWWWTCGYVHNNNNLEKHKDDSSSSIENSSNSSMSKKYLRLARYPMLRLQGGSGVVFGSTEQGRRCIPQKGPCLH